mmetsp:Transcript_21417/g.54556  ORF Transcript_21417/g.54556 Transcript_21417/m.54556 type:complete len:168 (-) Transcript_21417:538-1041(-)
MLRGSISAPAADGVWAASWCAMNPLLHSHRVQQVAGAAAAPQQKQAHAVQPQPQHHAVHSRPSSAECSESGGQRDGLGYPRLQEYRGRGSGSTSPTAPADSPHCGCGARWVTGDDVCSSRLEQEQELARSRSGSPVVAQHAAAVGPAGGGGDAYAFVGHPGLQMPSV